MIGYLMMAAVSGFAGWIYGRMQSQRIEDGLRLENAQLKDRCRVLRKLADAEERK